MRKQSAGKICAASAINMDMRESNLVDAEQSLPKRAHLPRRAKPVVVTLTTRCKPPARSRTASRAIDFHRCHGRQNLYPGQHGDRWNMDRKRRSVGRHQRGFWCNIYRKSDINIEWNEFDIDKPDDP